MAGYSVNNISQRDIEAIARTVEDEVGGIKGGFGNIDRVVDAIIGRSALGQQGIGGWGRSIQGVINAPDQFEGVTKAGGWANLGRASQATINAVMDRLAEIAATGRTTLSVDFENPKIVGDRRGTPTTALGRNNWTGQMPASSGYHVYGMRPGTEALLASKGILGPGLAVNITFDKQLAPTMTSLVANARQQDTPREVNAAAAYAAGVGRPAAQPDWSLADLAPLASQAPAPDWARDLTDRPAGTRGPVSDPYGFSNIRDAGFIPADGDLSALFGDPTTTGTITAQGYPGITSFGPNELGTPAPAPTYNSAGTFDPSNPLSAGTVPGAWDTPRTDFDRTGGLPSLAGYDPLETGREAFPTAGYNPMQPAEEAFPGALAGLAPIGTGVVGAGYSPSAVAASAPIGAPSTKGMSFSDMTRGIVGYDVKEVPNPAYSAWEAAWGSKPNSMQQAYGDDWADKIGVNRGNFAPLSSLAPAVQAPAPPSRTTTVSTPRYGDVPVGRPVSATLTAAPTVPATWTDQYTQQMLANNLAVNQFGNYGLTGFNGTFGTGLSLAGLAGTGTMGGWGTGYGGGFSGEGNAGGGFASQGGGEGFSGANSGGFAAGGSAGGPFGDARNENW